MDPVERPVIRLNVEPLKVENLRERDVSPKQLEKQNIQAESKLQNEEINKSPSRRILKVYANTVHRVVDKPSTVATDSVPAEVEGKRNPSRPAQIQTPPPTGPSSEVIGSKNRNSRKGSTGTPGSTGSPGTRTDIVFRQASPVSGWDNPDTKTDKLKFKTPSSGKFTLKVLSQKASLSRENPPELSVGSESQESGEGGEEEAELSTKWDSSLSSNPSLPYADLIAPPLNFSPSSLTTTPTGSLLPTIGCTASELKDSSTSHPPLEQSSHISEMGHVQHDRKKQSMTEFLALLEPESIYDGDANHGLKDYTPASPSELAATLTPTDSNPGSPRCPPTSYKRQYSTKLEKMLGKEINHTTQPHLMSTTPLSESSFESPPCTPIALYGTPPATTRSATSSTSSLGSPSSSPRVPPRTPTVAEYPYIDASQSSKNSTASSKSSTSSRTYEKKSKSELDEQDDKSLDSTYSIPGVQFRLLEGGKKAVTFYEVRAHTSNSIQEDIVFQRYSEFSKLHSDLQQQFGNNKVPKFPPKKIFRNLSPDFVEKRRKQLELYIRRLASNPDIANCQRFRLFMPDLCRVTTEDMEAHELYSRLKFSAEDTTNRHRCTISVQPNEKQLLVSELRGRSQTITLKDAPTLQFSPLDPETVATPSPTPDTRPRASIVRCMLNTEAEGASDATEMSFKFDSEEEAKQFCFITNLVIKDEYFSATRPHGYRKSGDGELTSTFANSEFVKPTKIKNFLNKYKMFIGSWNMARIDQSKRGFEGFIPSEGGDNDIVVLGLQECGEYDGRVNSEGSIGRALATHLGPKYGNLLKESLWEMRIFVFVRKELLPRIKKVETTNMPTGFLNVMGNKGGVSGAFKLDGFSVCFVNTHLAPHKENYDARNKMFSDLADGLRLGEKDIEICAQYDTIFWFGDLNYRIDYDTPQEILNLISKLAWDNLWRADQLRKAKKTNKAFVLFDEGPLVFAPTFKFILPKGSKPEVDDTKAVQRYIHAASVLWDLPSMDPNSRNSIEEAETSEDKRLANCDENGVPIERKEEREILHKYRRDMPASDPNQVLLPHQRPYALKRTPAWTDRILWLSNAAPECVTLKYYSSCEQILTSDHCPVCTTFELKTPVVPHEGAYTCHASIHILGASLYQVVPDIITSEQSISQRKLARVPTQMKPQQQTLLEAVNTGTAGSDVFLKFHGASFLSSKTRDKQTLYCRFDARVSATSEQFAIAHWDKKAIPILKSVIGFRQFVQNEKVIFSVNLANPVNCQADTVIGQGVISLAPLNTQTSWQFESHVLKAGRMWGKLKGRIFVDCPEP